MEKLFQQLHDAIQSGQPVCYTALVETRGSTPQKAGATMLVYPDGSQAGTLGGGCVEAEVKRRALRVLDHGDAELLTFQLDSNYGWDDGLICGGRMKMLVDPIHANAELSYFRRLIDLVSTGVGCTEAVVLDPEKAGGGQSAERLLFDATGKCVAARSPTGGVALAQPMAQVGEGVSIVERLRPLSQRPRPYVEQGVSYLPHLPRCRLIVVGAGHVGQMVAHLAADVDFDVWVVDDREEYCNPERFPKAKRLIVAPIDSALSGLEIDSSTYCLIVTRGHNHDEEALYHLAETPAAYVGLIGSRRKIKMIFEDLLGEGISRETLAHVYAPLGFDIGSQTVPEIAISIVAELVAHRNLGGIPARYGRESLVHEIGKSAVVE
jgi:xanthine dehydrogenase accessory factor